MSALLNAHPPLDAERLRQMLDALAVADAGSARGDRSGRLPRAAAARPGFRDAAAHHPGPAGLDRVGRRDVAQARGGTGRRGRPRRAFSPSTTLPCAPPGSARARPSMREGCAARSPRVPSTSSCSPSWRRRPRSRPWSACGASAAGVPRSTSCSRSAAPTSFPPTTSPSRSPTSASEDLTSARRRRHCAR